MRKSNIYLIVKNLNGSYYISGKIGRRLFFGYNKKEAIKEYNNECKLKKEN